MEQEVCNGGDNSLWRTIISLKFQTEDGGWFFKSPKGSYGVGLWREIWKEATQLKHYCSFEIGDGCNSLFEVAGSKGTGWWNFGKP